MNKPSYLSSEHNRTGIERDGVALRYSTLHESEQSLSQVSDIYFSYSTATANTSVGKAEAVTYSTEVPTIDHSQNNTAPETVDYEREARMTAARKRLEEL